MSKTQNQEEVLNFEKHFLKITSNFKQKERFEGFDLKKKRSKESALFNSGRPTRAFKVKWTQAHFSLKISADLAGVEKHKVVWAERVKPRVEQETVSPQPMGPVIMSGPIPGLQAQPVSSVSIAHQLDDVLGSNGVKRSGEGVEGLSKCSGSLGRGFEWVYRCR